MAARASEDWEDLFAVWRHTMRGAEEGQRLDARVLDAWEERVGAHLPAEARIWFERCDGFGGRASSPFGITPCSHADLRRLHETWPATASTTPADAWVIAEWAADCIVYFVRAPRPRAETSPVYALTDPEHVQEISPTFWDVLDTLTRDDFSLLV